LKSNNFTRPRRRGRWGTPSRPRRTARIPAGHVAPERERGDESAFEALREDFHFNLRLLRERDAHIDNLEAELARLRAAVELDASNALEASRARDEASRALDAKHASSLRDAHAAVEAARAEAADAHRQREAMELLAARARGAADSQADRAAAAAAVAETARAEAAEASRLCAAAEAAWREEREKWGIERDVKDARLASLQSRVDEAEAAMASRRKRAADRENALMARLVETEEEKAASERETAGKLEALEARARDAEIAAASRSAAAPATATDAADEGKAEEGKAEEKQKNPLDLSLDDPETRWRAAGAAAMLASQFQSTPRTAAAVSDAFSPRSAGSVSSAGAERPLAEVMETLATLSRRMDDQAASATAALSPAATSASARAALDCVVAATGDAAETLAEIEESLRSAKARRAARKQRESSQFSRGRSPLTNGEEASRSAPSGERLAGGSPSFSFFDRDAGAVAAAEAVAARVAKTRETRRPQERPTPDAATDLLRGGPIGDFFRDENEDEDEDEDAFAFGAPRVSRGDGTLNPEETPVRARLAAMAARLDAGGLGVSIGEPGLARDAFAPLARRFPSSGKPRGKPGAEQRRQKTKAPKAKANKAKRTTTKAKKNAARGKNAEPDPYDVLAMPRRRAASPEPARPRPFRANPVPMSNYLPPRMVPELPGTRRSEFGRGFGFDATASAAHDAEAVEATEERLAAVRIRREALAAARRNDERTLY
jgi:hypothetical protein